MLFAGGTVTPMTCPADGQQKNDKKDQTNTANMGAETKPKEARVDRNEVVGFVEFLFCACCFEVIWCV